jgi:transposase
MSDQSISVYQAASQLGISVHTVRRWCKDFSAHLSEGANPETGTARRLSAQDLAVLAEVSRLRGDVLSTPLIHQRLNETVFPAPIVESPHAAQEGRSEVLAPIAV